MGVDHPPQLARRIVAAIVGRSFSGREIVRDLDDEFRERALTDTREARRWYRREAAGFILRARMLRPRGDSIVTRFGFDVRHAVRALLKQPRFTLLASLTLALGVGAATVIFSLVNGVLLTPLPYSNPDRLVNIWSNAPKLGYDMFPLSPDLYVLFEKEPGLFEAMATFQTSRVNLTGAGAPDVVAGLQTSHTYFATIGVEPVRGRSFTADEDKPGGPPVAVISDRAWRTHFGADPAIIGRKIQIDGQTTDVIGVLPARIDEATSPDFFLPARIDRANPTEGSFGWNAIARLEPGVDAAAAQARLTAVALKHGERVTSAGYRAFLQEGAYNVLVHDMKEDLVGELEQPLWILLGTVGMLLAIACANVANLFLVRAEGRQLEIAVRTALGGTRGALVRGLMVEALVLSLAGSLIGVAGAAISLPALLRLAPSSIPRLNLVTVDWRVVAFAAAVSVLSAIVFGLVPALKYTRMKSLAALRQGGRGGTGEPARRRARHALVVLQTAIAVVMLVGSGLLAKSFAKLGATDPGFDSRDVLTFRVALPESVYKDRARRLQFAQQLTERLAALPGIQHAGAISGLPMASSSSGTAHEFDGQPIPPGALPPIVHYEVVEGDFFSTLRIPLLAGRAFETADYTPDAHTLLVNQALADHYWPGQNAVGKRVRVYSSDPKELNDWFTVVGVVGSVRGDGLREPARGLIYYAGTSANNPEGQSAFAYVVRGPGAANRADDVRKAVWGIDAGLPVASVQPMASVVSASIVEFTFTMLTLGIASILALALGVIGLYGVLSYAVMLRTREIGVRLALGATPAGVMRAVVANGVILATLGIAIGVAAAWGLTRYMTSLLFGTTPLDPATFIAMSLAMLAMASIASFLPARRAARVSPLESMKA